MFYKEFNDIKFRIIFCGVFFLLMLFALIALRPIVGEIFGDMNAQMTEVPEFLKKIVGDFSGLNKLEKDNDFYLISQWQGKNFGQFVPLFILIAAFPIFVREIDKKTIYFLLAKKKRKEIFKAKFLTGFISVLSVITIFSLLGSVFMNLFGYKTGFGQSFQVLVQELIASSFFFSGFITLSLVFNDQIKPVVVGIALIMGLPLLSIFNQFQFLNIYPYLQGESILAGGSIDWVYSIGLGILFVFLTVINYIIFKKKEY